MKTRIVALLLVAATLAGVAIAQIPAVQSILAPLSGSDREIIVETYRSAANHELFLKRFLSWPNTPPQSGTYWDGRADAWTQAADFLESYDSGKIRAASIAQNKTP